MFGRRLMGSALGVFLFCAPAFAATGLEYLAGQQNADGSFGGRATSLATPVQSTAEVLRAYQALGQTSAPSFAPAIAFLNGDLESNTEFLARKILVNADAGQSVAALAGAIAANQNETGAFGSAAGDDGSVLDTAFALEAFVSANATASPQAAAAVGYLLSQQQSSGGWADGDNSASIYLTALSMRALWFYRFQYVGVADSLARAQMFLLSARESNDLWGEHFNSALALIALIPVVSDLSVVNNGIAALQAAQSPNGSWSDDAYTTALALRAINAAAQPRVDPTAGAVAGRVVDDASGAALSGVTLTATGSAAQSATTDVDGRYLLSNVAPGAVVLSASFPGYLTAGATATVQSGRAIDFSPRLVRDPQPTAVTIRGAVVRSDTGVALAGATVRVINTALSVQTQTDGRFDLAGIPAGSVRVEISLAGFSSASFAVSASSGGAVDFGLVPLAPGTTGGTSGTVQGTVVDALTDQPLRGVSISISGADSRTALTDAGGRFTIANVTPGNLALAASLDSYQTATASGVVTGGSTLNFSARLVKAGNPVRTTISGRVVDATTAAPLSGASIAVGGLQGTTAPDGGFQIGDLSAGRFTLIISISGYVGVTYSASAPNGGSVALGTIALARDVPVTGNRNPVITSRGPTSIAAGLVYAYNVQATDADGDALTFALGTKPNGMTISPTGQVRWIPTVDQVGTKTFSVVVFDPQGGRAEELVNVNVTAGGSRSYVVTDVPTLTELYLNSFVPDNYTLARYIRGGRPGNVNSSPPCPIGAGIGLTNVDVAAAFNTLERLAGQPTRSAIPDAGLDIVSDLGEARSSVTVFPHIDHEPFPEEGIEYTVWGANDPDAAFPDGWRLATLVSIYRRGFAQSPSCANQDEVDDFAGLYTFGANSYRYLRIRTDKSITIFRDREHTTWATFADEGGEPGWQSIEGEVDAVGGLVCDVKPTANAGANILGVTGQTIRFNGSGAGDILAYSWDLDGDGVIDLTGPNPTYVFANEFDRDATLFVVDDRGCVGTDTVHVTIGVNFPRPDLTVNQVDTSAAVTDVQTLRITGNVRVAVQNVGRAAATTPALVTVFEDTNRNGVFDDGTDNVLGSLSTPSGLARGASLSINVPVNGAVSLRDSPLLAMVDSDRRIDEEREDNNIARNIGACFAAPPTKTFDPVLKWEWTGSDVLPSFNQVIGAPVVAPLEDTNGDGLIDGRDIPAIIFVSYQGLLEHEGVLRAISGKDGHALWTATNVFVNDGETAIAVGDIDGDGLVEILTMTLGGQVLAYEHTGALKWTSPVNNIGMSAIALADLNGDGIPEIIVGGTVLKADGSLLWRGTGFQGTGDTLKEFFAMSVVADIDLDGKPEVIAGAAAYSNTGQLLWQNESAGDGLAAVGNFNADPYPEIVVVSRGRVSLLNYKGEILWGPVQLPGIEGPGSRDGSGGAPTIADLDGDGIPEIGVATLQRYTVLKADGSILWSVPIRDPSGITGSAVFDFDGDGRAEVVYGDHLNLHVFRGTDGAVLFETRNTSGTGIELPVIADVDGDGHADIVVIANDFAQLKGIEAGPSYRGIRVFQDRNNSWVNTRKIWNQHSYHITNVNDDGTIPRVEKNSWLAQNTYRLNAFPERTAPAIPDLTVAMLRAIQGAGGLVQLSVRVGNAGSGIAPAMTVAFYEGDPTLGGRLLGNASVAALQPGEFRDVAFELRSGLSGQGDIFAVVDPSNEIAECREDNNRISGPAKTQSAAGRIAVATDAASYGAQAPVAISSSATNTSSLPAAFNVSVRVEDSSGAVLTTFGTRSAGSLAGGASVVLTETWNTNGFLAGNYRIRAQLLSIDGGALLDEALATFSIRATTTGTTPNVTLRTTADRPTYNTVDLVNIQSLVANTTTNTLFDSLRLRLRIKDAAGTVLFTNEGPLGQLPPSSLRDMLLAYGLNGSPVGTFRIEGEVIDATGAVLASSSTQFNVAADAAKSLTGQVSVANTAVEIGASQLCTYTVTNRGTEAFNGVSLRMTVVNITSGMAVETANQTVSLAPSGTQTIIRSVATTNLTPGDYACALEALVDGAYKSLGFAAFKAVEPPIRIDAALTVGEKGRLLILLDTTNRCDADDENDYDADYDYRWGNNNSSSCPAGLDPHGPKGAPSLAAQRAFLETLLKQAGWSYTITDNASAFTREFRTGGYSAYALLSEQVRLDEQVQKELREAIFRGDGLIVAGSHDNRNNRLNDALGLKRIGTVAQALNVAINDAALGQGAFALVPGDRINRVSRTSAQSLAVYELSGPSKSSDYDCRDEDDDHYKDRDNPRYANDDDCHRGPDAFVDAITLNNYGDGKALFAGFDLLAQATRDGASSPAATALRSALTVTHPEPLKARIHGVVPIVLTLVNQGNATAATAIVTVPTGASVVDAGSGTVQAAPGGQTITWTTSLALREEKRLTFYIRLPNSQASIILNAKVSVNNRLITQTTLTVSVHAVTPVDQLLAQTNALASTLPAYRNALNAAASDLDKAENAKRLDSAIGYVIKATDDLLGITDAQVKALRQRADEWLRYMLLTMS